MQRIVSILDSGSDADSQAHVPEPAIFVDLSDCIAAAPTPFQYVIAHRIPAVATTGKERSLKSVDIPERESPRLDIAEGRLQSVSVDNQHFIAKMQADNDTEKIVPAKSEL